MFGMTRQSQIEICEGECERMSKPKIRLQRLLTGLLVFGIVVSTVGCSFKKVDIEPTKFPESSVKTKAGNIEFIDLGMSESTLITTEATTILVDTGSVDSYDTLREHLKGNKVNTIDCLIVTSPIPKINGAAQRVVEDYKVRSVLVPKWSNDVINKYESYIQFNNACIKNSIKMINTNYGYKATVGGIKIQALGPQSDFYNDENDYAMITRFTFGGMVMLNMSTAGNAAEQELTSGRFTIQSDILRSSKLNVKGANSNEFINTVSPKIIVAPGSGKGYKQPRKEVEDTIKQRETELVKLKEHGTVYICTDGRNIGLTSDYYRTNGANGAGGLEKALNNKDSIG